MLTEVLEICLAQVLIDISASFARLSEDTM